MVQISAWKGFGEECWWGRDALQCRGYPRRWWRLCGCGRRLCVVVGVLGEGGEFVAGGNVVFVHGAVRVHHAAREVLRPQLAPVPVEGGHLSACTQSYDVSCSMRSLVNIPPFSTLLGPWNRLSIFQNLSNNNTLIIIIIFTNIFSKIGRIEIIRLPILCFPRL